MSAIDDKYAELGGAAGFLGNPVSPETTAPDGVGAFRHYQGGSIYWSPNTGAHEVHGAIREKWVNLGSERSFLGYPLTDEFPRGDDIGRCNHFQGGSILWSPSTGAFEVHGGIRDKYEALAWERSFLGYPITDETSTPDGVGRFNHFQGGSIYWTQATGAHEVHGAIREKWSNLGWERSFLGYPLTDETSTPGGGGRFNHFQGGSIYWSAATGAHEVHGGIRAKWSSLGWEQGFLGFPLTDETSTPDGVGRFNHFQGGSIYWTAWTGPNEVHGAIRERWANLGWERNDLGYPITDETSTPDGRGRFNHFQGGSLFWDPSTGVREVHAPSGRWDVQAQGSQALAVHAALLPTGKVVYFSGSEHDVDQGGLRQFDHTRLWEPATGNVQVVGSPPQDLFCCGHAFLSTGELLVAGGNEDYDVDPGTAHGDLHHYRGVRECSIFNPNFASGTNPWVATTPMQYERNRTAGGGRWYPTLVTLPDGSVFMTGGHPEKTDTRHNNYMVEVYNPATRTWTDRGDTPDPRITYYPRLHLLPDGQVFCASPMMGRCYKWSPSSGNWTNVAPAPGADYAGFATSSVLLPLRPNDYRPQILMVGAAQPLLLDLGAPAPAWQNTAARTLAGSPVRQHANAVLLPDGSVLVLGGTVDGSDTAAVMPAERFDPATGQWSTLSSMTVPRVYHSVALLLPDGRIWVAGSDHNGGRGLENRELRMEVYSPPYLFRGPRPVINSAPATVSVGSNFTIGTPQAAVIQSVALLRCGSVTHCFNGDQRYVGLNIVDRTTSSLTVTAPPNRNIAPPGYYLLFLLDGSGVPSIGSFVRVA